MATPTCRIIEYRTSTGSQRYGLIIGVDSDRRGSHLCVLSIIDRGDRPAVIAIVIRLDRYGEVEDSQGRAARLYQFLNTATMLFPFENKVDRPSLSGAQFERRSRNHVLYLLGRALHSVRDVRDPWHRRVLLEDNLRRLLRNYDRTGDEVVESIEGQSAGNANATEDSSEDSSSSEAEDDDDVDVEAGVHDDHQ